MLARLAIACFVIAPFAVADVTTVPPGAGSLAEAIAAAEPGDTLQLLPGIYSTTSVAPIIVVDKPLRIVGAGPGQTTIELNQVFTFFDDMFTVTGIQAGEDFELIGVTLSAGYFLGMAGLAVADCTGVVALVDVEFEPLILGADPFLDVRNCASFIAQDVIATNPATFAFANSRAQLTDCSVDGYDASLAAIPQNGQVGMIAKLSQIVLSGCSVTGGDGGQIGFPVSADGNGRAAIELKSSNLTLIGACHVTGGDTFDNFESGARGGAAIEAGNGSTVRVDASVVLEGGSGFFMQAPGIVAEPLANVVLEDRRALALTTQDDVFATGTALIVEISGEPLAMVQPYFALAPLDAPQAFAGIDGFVALDLELAVQVTPAPFMLLPDGSGSIALNPSCVPTELVAEYSWQFAEILPDGSVRASNAVLTIQSNAE